MPEHLISTRLETRSPIVRGELEEVISSLEGVCLQESESPSSCDLLILEIGDDLEKEFQIIHDIQASGMVGEIFLTSSRLEADVLIQALRAGAKEFFPQPIKKEEVRNAFLKFKERKEKPLGGEKKKRGKIIDIIGSKGGVGTTTVAVNLATSLIESGGSPSVALMDMNLLFGEIPIFLNIESSFNWGEVAIDISRVDSTYLMSSLSKHPSGVYVLPSPSGLDGIATSEIIGKILDQVQCLFDFVVIDGGQSLNDISLKILRMSDMVLLIALLNLPCLTNVKRLLWTFQRLGYPPEEDIKIIINRNHKRSVIPTKQAEESIKKGIFWQIPNDFHTTMSAIDQGKTLSSVAHNAEVTKSLRELASHLSQNGLKPKVENGFFHQWNFSSKIKKVKGE